jgi:hypothetical protein
VTSGPISGFALRWGLAALATIAVTIAMAGVPDVGFWSVIGIVMVLLVVGTAFAPGTVIPLLFLLGLVAYRLMGDGSTVDMGLFALVALMPAIHLLAGVAGGIPLRARLHWTVLRPSAIRYCIAVIPVEIGLAALALVR